MTEDERVRLLEKGTTIFGGTWRRTFEFFSIDAFLANGGFNAVIGCVCLFAICCF